MRKIILMMLLAVVSNSAMAEWVKVGAGGGAEILADPATIRKTGNMVKMWVLFNFSTPRELTDGPTYLSMKIQEQYDCEEEQTRSLYSTIYPEKGGKGNEVGNKSTPGNWLPVSPKSVSEILYKVACKSK